MLFASTTFFPPWYFWLFELGVVIVIVWGVVTMIVGITRASCNRRIRERELASRLMEVMLQDRALKPIEIEGLFNAYWRSGSFWNRFRAPPAAAPPSKATYST